MFNKHEYVHIHLYVLYIVSLNYSCDADPSALAKYVVALVKKDKSEKELKALCIDQLDVFLQKGKQSLIFMQTVFCRLWLYYGRI